MRGSFRHEGGSPHKKVIIAEKISGGKPARTRVLMQKDICRDLLTMYEDVADKEGAGIFFLPVKIRKPKTHWICFEQLEHRYFFSILIHIQSKT